MSPDYERVIAQEEKVLASIQEQSEKIIPELKRTTAVFLRDWAIALLKGYLKRRPDIAQGLTPQRSEALKKEFTAILEAFPAAAEERLKDPHIWLHRVPIPKYELADLSYSYQFEKRSHNAIEGAIKELIGPVGALLNKYGLIEIEDNIDWELGPDSTPRWTYKLPTRGIEGHPALSKVRERYKNLLIEYVFASQNLLKALEDKEAAGGGK
ncbi:MAG: hypothetical protein ACK2TZ_02385 [Anaerolineales bacterium]